MLKVEQFVSILRTGGVGSFTGVLDLLLKKLYSIPVAESCGKWQ